MVRKNSGALPNDPGKPFIPAAKLRYFNSKPIRTDGGSSRERSTHTQLPIEEFPSSAIAVVDANLQHTLAVGELFDLFGTSAEAVKGEPIESVFPPDCAAKLQAKYLDALDGNTDTSRITCCDRDFRIQTAPVRGDGDDVVAAVGVFLDLSGGNRYERALETLETWNSELLAAKTATAVHNVLVEAVIDVGAPEAIAYTFDAASVTLTPVATSKDSEEVSAISPGEHVVWEAYKQGRIAFGEDQFVAEESTNAADRHDGFAIPFGDTGVLAVTASEEPVEIDCPVGSIRLLSIAAETAIELLQHEASLQERDAEIRRQTESLDRIRSVSETFGAVIRATIASDTRQEIDSSVCDRLLRHDPISFVWLGTVDREDLTITPKTWAGNEQGYLGRAPFALEGSDEPAAKAAVDREIRIIDNVAAATKREQWRPAAIERGFRSVVAIPLTYRGVLHGVVTVYTDREWELDEGIENVFADLGTAIGNAITAIQRKNALSAHKSIELDIEITAPACFFVRFVREHETGVTFESMSPKPDGTILVFVTGDEPDVLLTRARNAAVVDSAQVVDEGPDGDVLGIRFDDSFIGSVLAMHGIRLERAQGTPEEVKITVSIPPTMSPRDALEVIKSEYPGSTLLAKRENHQGRDRNITNKSNLFGRLTERQQEVVELAYSEGYFETPRQVTGNTLATALDISSSAFHNHLRAAEAELFSWLFEENDVRSRNDR